MSNIPADLRFAESHEWARLEADGTVTVGISDHAQEALGDVVFVELAEVGAQFGATDQAGVVESVKAASDIYAPVAGEVIAVNEELSGSPELLNSDPYGAWIFKLKPSNPADLEKLLDAAGYKAAIGEGRVTRCSAAVSPSSSRLPVQFAFSTAFTAATDRSTSASVIAVNIGNETIKRPTFSATGNMPSLKPCAR